MSNVEFDKRPEFRRAIRVLMQNGTYGNLVHIHGERITDPDGFVHAKHRMHGSMFGPVGFRRFLPWHRAYLIAFERELRNIDELLSNPYWDWDNDQGRMMGIENFMGLSSGREIGLLLGDPPNPNRVRWFSDRSMTQSFEIYGGDYYTFSRELEGKMHNNGHAWVGGDMGNPAISPNDPIFWMHHGQIDRIWAVWQQINFGERAFLTDDESPLDPWDAKFTVETIDSISNLGADSYKYAPPPGP